jgi:hypothetical protein
MVLVLRTVAATAALALVAGTLTATVANAQPGSRAADATVTATPGNGRVDLGWTTTRTDITGWTAARNGVDTGGGGPWSIDLPGSARTQDFTYLVNGREYTFTLTPRTAAGALAPVSVTAVPGTTTTPPPTTPPPSGGYIATATPGNGRVDLGWTTTRTDITGWTAARNGVDTGGGGPWSIDLPASARSQDFTYLVNGREYTFTLTPRTAAGALAPVTVTAVPGTTTTPPPTSPPAPGGAVRYVATPADAFVDTVGVAVHKNYLDTAYGEHDVAELLARLGIRNVRDGAIESSLPFYREWTATGNRRVSIVVDPDDGDILQSLQRVNDLGPGVASQIESDNEPNCDGWQPGAIDRLKAQARSMRAKMDTLPNLRNVPLTTPSMCGGGDPDSYRAYGDDGVSARFNIHPYPGGEMPETLADDQVTWVRGADPDAAVTVTEGGYHNGVRSNNPHKPTSELAAGAYMPRMFLDYARQGIVVSHSYELLDEFPDPGRIDAERNFGLYRYDGSIKPAGASVAALLKTLTDTGTRPAAQAVDIATSGAGAELQVQPFARSDGSLDVVLWRAQKIWDQDARVDLANPPANVTVTVTVTGQHTASFVRINGNENPTRSALNTGSSFTVPVSGHPTILRLAPTGAASTTGRR